MQEAQALLHVGRITPLDFLRRLHHMMDNIVFAMDRPRQLGNFRLVVICNQTVATQLHYFFPHVLT